MSADRAVAAAGARRLEGRVAVITGAATGIGRATARLFAAAGAKVVLSDVRAEELEQALAAVKGAGGEAAMIAGDLAQADACAAVVDAAVRAYGRLDVVFNNAGVGTMVVGGTIETIPVDRWDLAQNVNVRASRAYA